MTSEQKALLRPHGEHFQQMASYVRECDPEELDALEEAAAAADATNIAWDAYAAAQFLLGEIASLRLYRARHSTAAVGSPPKQTIG